MLHIICAEKSEAERLNIKNGKVVVHITGAGLYNVLKYPRIDLKSGDEVLNIGYAGSNVFAPGDVYSVNSCQRLNPSKTIHEQKQYLYPYYFLGADCFTADDFVESSSQELPLIDMELYYLALIYPEICSIKIVSDNLSYKQFKQADFTETWERVNRAVEELAYGQN